MKTRAPSALAATTVLLLILLAPLSAAAPPPQAAEVHPDVWKALEAGEEAEVLILLRQQADLSGAGSATTKEAKGRAVYEALWWLVQLHHFPIGSGPFDPWRRLLALLEQGDR